MARNRVRKIQGYFLWSPLESTGFLSHISHKSEKKEISLYLSDLAAYKFIELKEELLPV